MTRTDVLWERYEDALFSLLMDAVAEAEGRKALEENERLKCDPSADMPAGLKRKCLHTIRSGFTAGSVRRGGRTVLRLFSRLSVLIMVLLLSLTVVFAASPSARSHAAHWVAERFGDRTELHFSGGGGGPAEGEASEKPFAERELTAGWIPEGFSLADSGRDRNGAWQVYRSEHGLIRLSTFLFHEGGVQALDTEDADISFAAVRGHTALVITKGDEMTLFVPVDEQGATVMISGQGVSPDDVYAVANSLTLS